MLLELFSIDLKLIIWSGALIFSITFFIISYILYKRATKHFKMATRFREEALNAAGGSILSLAEENLLLGATSEVANKLVFLKKGKYIVHQIACRAPLGDDNPCTCGLARLMFELSTALTMAIEAQQSAAIRYNLGLLNDEQAETEQEESDKK